MILETKRLILRDYTMEDRLLYYKLKNDKETMYYLQDIMLHSKEEADDDFNRMLSDMESEDRRYYFFHIEIKSTGEQIGSIGYSVIDDTPVGKIVHAGYFTYPKYWYNGYVTEAFKKVLEFAFTQNNVYRVTTGCLQENQGSEKVIQKCGLIKEAEHVDWEWHDGKLKTRVEYRMLRSEWND